MIFKKSRLLFLLSIAIFGMSLGYQLLAIAAETASSEQENDDSDELDNDIIVEDDEPEDTPTSSTMKLLANRTIKNIVVQGNKQVTQSAILHRIPYRIGEVFDVYKTRSTIKKLYKDLKRFRYIELLAEPVGDSEIIIYVRVEEKKALKEFQLIGNSQLTNKEILDKVPLESIPAIDAEELKVLVKKIKKLYADKGFHAVDIDARLELDAQDKASAIITFTEHPRSLVKRIEFIGNDHVKSKTLRSIMYSREDWLLGFMDQSGIYQPERIEADKHVISQYYQNQGFMNARITNVKTEFDECGNIKLEFEVDEGNLYCFGAISVQDTPEQQGEYLAAFLPIKQGDNYSREAIVDSIKMLERFWNDRGYMFANIEPVIVANDEARTVDVSFKYDLGEKVFLNRLTVIGNQKTRDKIIRRQLLLDEGGIITESAMEASKARVESLGYFDVRDGVNWKIHRVNESLADLELILKETKTGHANVQFGFGGTANLNSPADGATAEINISDSNLNGWGIATSLVARWSKAEKTFIANVTQPWLFDRPILSAFDVYHKRLGYENFGINNAIDEQRTGASFTLGFIKVLRQFYFADVFVRMNLGLDKIDYNNIPPNLALNPDGTPVSDVNTPAIQHNQIFRKEFAPGLLNWLTITVGQDKKNHPMHPNRGYSWVLRSYTGLPIPESPLGFERLDFDYHWYTPLIGNHDLIFHWHNFLGVVMPIADRLIPYGELFNTGGPASVRGYLFGDLSPRFTNGVRADAIGGSKTFFVNAELIFPIQPDMSIKGLLFYDGGSGWDSPYQNGQNAQFIRNNSFDYRHSIGAGIRLLNPMPISIDVGFKLDPRENEKAYEVHFGMNYGWQ